MFDNSDVIFAANGERIRNILDLADRVESVARGDRIYLTIARRGRRVQICMVVSPYDSRLWMDQWRRMQWRRRWRRLSAYAPLMLGLAVIVVIVLLAVLLYLRVAPR
jgi:hypothetical protein